jgi:radical SAM protein with 4Fe4S-binding SPASM domain
VGVSLDGPTAAHNRARGQGTFERARATIERLVALGIETYVNYTVMRGNVESIPAMFAPCEELGAQGLVLQQLHCSGRASRDFYDANLLTFQQMEWLRRVLPGLIAHHPNVGFVDSEVLFFLGSEDRYASACKPTKQYRPNRLWRCGAGRRFCVIQANLDVIPCGILGAFPCGNLRCAPFSAIWRDSEGFARIREQSELRTNAIRGCAHCRYLPVCDGGCRGDTFNRSGDWLGTHPACPFAERGA